MGSPPDVAKERVRWSLHDSGPGVERIIDALPGAIYTTDAEGHLTSFNRAAVRLSGRVPELSTDRWCVSFKLYRPDGRFLPHSECPMAVALREGRGLEEEIVLERPDGERFDVLACPTPIRDEAGRIVGAVNMLLDITDRKRAEQTQALLASIVTASDDAIISKTLEGVIQSWNHGAERTFGYSAEEAIGQPITLIVPPELYREEEAILERLRRGERIEHFETERVTKDGRRVNVSLTVSPVRDASGRVIGASKVSRDITEKKLAEQRLRTSEERYRRLMALLPVAVYTCDASGVISFYNEQAASLWGRRPVPSDTDERFCGSHRLRRPDGTPLPHAECPMAVALSKGHAFRNEEVLIERPDSSLVHALVNIDPVRDESGRIAGAINVFYDITELKRTERALREQKENLQTLLDTLPIAVLIAHDPECRSISGNRAAARLLRMAEGSNLSKTAIETRPTHFKIVAAGHEVPDDALPVQRAARGESVEAEEVEHVFDDGSRVQILVSARPLYDAGGRPRGAVAGMLDVTEVRRAEAALRETDRRKDEFLALLGHELRNPLAPLATSIDLLSVPSPEIEHVRAMMQRQVEHLVRLVDDLLDLSRISRGTIELRRSRFDLRSTIDTAVEFTNSLIKQRAHALALDLGNQPLPIEGDRHRLVQVIGNLLSNAAKYTEPGGRISICVGVEQGAAVVRVRDTGLGIPSERLESIFEMFGQVPEHRAQIGASGLGIGLALAHQIVALHGGSIAAHSEGPGRGSEFVMHLPLATPADEAKAPAASDAVSRRAVPRVHRRVLVVDDNVDAAESLGAMLELKGHRVCAVHNGQGAIDALKTFAPEVVLLDLGMPGKDGYEVARQIRTLPLGQSILLVAVTGWGQEDDKRRAVEAGFDLHFIKPVDPARLAAVISEPPDGHWRA